MPNYARPEFSPCEQRPAKGTRILKREEADAAALKLEREQKAIAKTRDGRCRWPEKHKCRGGEDEAAHIQDASLLGPMAAANLVRFCPWIHRRGPESIHGKQLKVEAETERGAAGRCRSGDSRASSMPSGSRRITSWRARLRRSDTRGTDERTV